MLSALENLDILDISIQQLTGGRLKCSLWRLILTALSASPPLKVLQCMQNGDNHSRNIISVKRRWFLWLISVSYWSTGSLESLALSLGSSHMKLRVQVGKRSFIHFQIERERSLGPWSTPGPHGPRRDHMVHTGTTRFTPGPHGPHRDPMVHSPRRGILVLWV